MLNEHQYYILNNKIFFIVGKTNSTAKDIVFVKDLAKQTIPQQFKHRIEISAKPISPPKINNITPPDKLMSVQYIASNKYYYDMNLKRIIFSIGETNYLGDPMIRFVDNLMPKRLVELFNHMCFEMPFPIVS